MMDSFDMSRDILEVLVSQEELERKIKEVGAQISKDYAGKVPILVGILKGVVPFFAAMAQAITIPLEEDFMCISSYDHDSFSGQLKLKKDVDLDIKGRDVIILEDILDSGRTLKMVKEMLQEREPNSVRICTMLDKPEGRVVELDADYVCATVPDAFVVGFGLDYNDRYRNLPYVGVLKPEIYEGN